MITTFSVKASTYSSQLQLKFQCKKDVFYHKVCRKCRYTVTQTRSYAKTVALLSTSLQKNSCNSSSTYYKRLIYVICTGPRATVSSLLCTIERQRLWCFNEVLKPNNAQKLQLKTRTLQKHTF